MYVRSDGFLCADNYYAAENKKSKYNLREVSFYEAWQKSFNAERDIKFDTFGICKNCELIQSNGFCDLQNSAMSKYLYNKDEYCGVYPALKKLKIERNKL